MYSRNVKAENIIIGLAKKMTEKEMNLSMTFFHHTRHSFYINYVKGDQLAEEYLLSHSLLTDDLEILYNWHKSAMPVDEYVKIHRGSVISRKFGF